MVSFSKPLCVVGGRNGNVRKSDRTWKYLKSDVITMTLSTTSWSMCTTASFHDEKVLEKWCNFLTLCVLTINFNGHVFSSIEDLNSYLIWSGKNCISLFCLSPISSPCPSLDRDFYYQLWFEDSLSRFEDYSTRRVSFGIR